MTNIDSVYEVFLSKFDDYTWLVIDKDVIRKLMRTYLNSSISKFKKTCKHELVITDNAFSVELTDSEIEILAKLMLINYLNPKIVREENLRQNITTKDYNDFSKANLLKNLIALRDSQIEDVEKEISEYDYDGFGGLN